MMNPEDLLFATLSIDVALTIIGCQIWFRMTRRDKRIDLLQEKLYDATRRFANHKQELQEKNLHLQTQLEKAEKAWGDLQIELQYKELELNRFLVVYKRLETSLQDQTVKYNNLVRQYTFLTSKSPNDEMPI